MANRPHGSFTLTFENEHECELLLHELLDYNEIAIWDEGDGQGYAYIDNIIKIQLHDGILSVYYYLEYMPLDKYMIFEIERHSLFAYKCLKDQFGSSPILSHNQNYPSSELLVGYEGEKFSRQFIIDFYLLAQQLMNFYKNRYIINAAKTHEYFNKTLKNKLNTLVTELTISEYLYLKNELQNLNWIMNLITRGFQTIDGNCDLNQTYSNGEVQITLTEAVLNENFYKKN